jgi:hypothetical protein
LTKARKFVGALLVPRRDPVAMLDAVEESFELIPSGVEIWAEADRIPPVAIEDTPVVHAGNAARLAGQDGFDEAPFSGGEGISHSRSSLLGLESRPTS